MRSPTTVPVLARAHENPSMNLQFLTADNADWDKFLSGVQHDFYHLPSYARLMAPFDGGQPEAVLIRDQDQFFFLPYIVRPLSHIDWLGEADARLFDIVSPYGYPGPLMSAETSCLARLVSQWHEAMRARGCVSGFIRLHPLLDATNDVLGTCGELIERGRTISIDLRCSLERALAADAQNHRRDIVKRRRSGMTVAIENEAKSLEIFAEIYHETMDRVGAAGYYYFPFEYFQGLREALGEQFSLCIVRRRRAHRWRAGSLRNAAASCSTISVAPSIPPSRSARRS